ncbi:uncharacterized protein DS421_3g76020 [Arachis hypogaea]|nr:uncharacterized protein DS421_3g76020 [Arachis hypogaea]
MGSSLVVGTMGSAVADWRRQRACGEKRPSFDDLCSVRELMASTGERLGWGGTKEGDIAAAWVSMAALGFGGFGFAERERER